MERTLATASPVKYNHKANKVYIPPMLSILAFLLLNTLKTTLFNFFIMEESNIGTFVYKLLFSLLIYVFIYSMILRIKNPVFLLVFYLAQAAYIISNLCYFNYFHNYLHLFQLAALFTEGMGAVKHFSVPLDYNLLIIFMDVPAFICLMTAYSSSAEAYKQSRHAKPVLMASAFLLLLIEGWNYLNAISVIQLARDFSAGEAKIVERYGTAVNSLCDIIFNKGGKNLITHFQYGNLVSNTSENPEKPNFIVIQVESMDANVITHKHNGKYITPYLNRLSGQGIYYPFALSYHKSGGTSDCEFSIINSVEPLGNFPSIKLASYDYPNSILKRLNEKQYTTLAFHGNIGNFYNRDAAFPKMGFDEFYDIRKMNFEDIGWGAPDHEVYSYALKKLEAVKEPFLAYFITMSSHGPFNSVDSYYANSSYDDVGDDRTRSFFTSMSYTDQAIENFISNVESRFKNTYILIWGDHTPDVDSEYYKQAAFSSGNDYFEFVPLIIITPDKRVYRESSRAASFLDIGPTILSASGIEFSIRSKGISLLHPVENGPAIPFKDNEYDRNDLYKRVLQLKEEY